MELFDDLRARLSRLIGDALDQAETVTDRDAAYRQLSWLAR
ncbi:MAG TPA: hypothetical protein VGG25_03435 [Streptosporangiaceae bacterium]